jgi:hypothetical protein
MFVTSRRVFGFRKSDNADYYGWAAPVAPFQAYLQERAIARGKNRSFWRATVAMRFLLLRRVRGAKRKVS